MHSKADTLDPPIPEVEDKSMRGITHPQLARWFCPRNKLDVFDRNPDDKIVTDSGKLKMTAMNWPTGFYEDGVYDSQDKTKGLFRNHVVARFYTHLYIGPSAAMAESTTSKASKVARNRAFGLTSVTKNIIAIVHIINWTNEIGTMNLEELFWAIIDILDDDEDPWVKDTMAWWNARVASGAHKARVLKKPSDSEDDSDQQNDIAEIKAQRLARRGAPSLPPPSKTKRARQVEPESDEDVEADDAPPSKKKSALSAQQNPHKKAPAAAALFDDDKSHPVKMKSTPPRPRHVQPKSRPQPPPAAESSDEDPAPPSSMHQSSKRIRTNLPLPKPPIELSDDDDKHSPPPPCPAKETTSVGTTKRRRHMLPESDDEDIQELAPLPSPPPTKKIRSDSPLPPLTEDEDDDPLPLPPPPPPKPTKQAKKA
ncbi:hypothetical protein F4604DRAFT_1679163 [Suillus subluteus]|nr:hypothetical protein F4604DRAFT_1679163 [Suillus subluteus]